MISKQNIKVSTIIPKEVHKRLSEDAAYEDRTVSKMIAKILKEHYNFKENDND